MPRRYLGAVPHLAVGVRLPDIVAPPVIKAFKLGDMVGTLMLSYHRETAPTNVIKSGEHILLGHTGTSISEYVSKATKYADELNALIQVEADHVSLMSSPERAIKRITGGGFEYGLSEDEIRKSLEYIEREFKEVKDAGGVDFVTIDTCELIDLSVDTKSKEDLMAMYEERVEEGDRRALKREYVDRTFRFFLDSGRAIEVRYREEDVVRLALKFLRSVKYVKVVRDIAAKYLEDQPFGVEIALDEVPQPTRPEELLFYLRELRRVGVVADFIAPNIGFKKREDFDGNLAELAARVEILNTIAKANGALLSFHSGSGAHPYSDKGLGTWGVIREVTGGLLKYKVSGVFIQLLLEVMASFSPSSKPRQLYEEIYDKVIEVVKQHVESKTGLYSPHLERMLRDYEAATMKNPGKKHDPRADVFRHYFFVFQAVMDSKGRRYLREELLNLYESDDEFRRKYEKEATALALRIAWKLGLTGNYLKYVA